MANAPTRASGYMSESALLGSTYVDTLETVPDLLWPTSVQTFGRMRTDPQLTAVLNAYTLPLRQAPKHVDPAGCRDEVVQLISDDLGLPILGADTEPGPARRRGVDFDEHFRISLLDLVFGHMGFAQQYEVRDGKARLVKLSERMPSTITDILTTDDGDLDGVLQFGESSIIPASHLVWYVHEREGAAWQGRSMLRSAYGAWLLKHEMWRVHATSNRRFGMGVPTVNAPPGATDAQLEQATLLAAAIRVGDQSGVALPHGFTQTIQGITGSTPDTLAFIRYLDSQMAQMALASVLNLDASPNGSRALGDTFVNLMLTSLNAVGKEKSSTLTQLSVQITDYNWGEDEPAPRIVIGDAGSRPEVTAEAITALLNAGAITSDPELERWTRERWALPQREDTPEGPLGSNPRELVEMVQKVYLGVGTVLSASEARGILNQAGANLVGDLEQSPAVLASRVRQMAASGTKASTHRGLTPTEVTAAVDPATLDAQWTTALEDLLSEWGDLTTAQREDLTAQIQAAVDADDIDALADLTADSEHASEILAAAMITMAGVAAAEARQEAKRQGVSIKGGKADESRLTAIARTVTSIISASTAGAAGREALRVWSDGRTGADVAGMVDGHLSGLSDTYLRDQLGNALSAAQNAGRQAVTDAGPPAKYFASEVLDKNTCKNCRDIDGHQFESKQEAGDQYASGGYTECLGRLRCRGIVVTVYGDGTP